MRRRSPAVVRTRRANPAGGFTLLEVLVALAILSLAVVTAIQLFAGGLRLLKTAGEHQAATMLADQKAREVDTPVEGQETGSAGQFTWERTIRDTEVPSTLGASTARPLHVYAVTVQVRWGGNRSVEVATLRTAHPTEPGDATGAGARPTEPRTSGPGRTSGGPAGAFLGGRR
jgi:general secretion pathway protein I